MRRVWNGFEKRGGWNKRGGWKIFVRSINVEGGFFFWGGWNFSKSVSVGSTFIREMRVRWEIVCKYQLNTPNTWNFTQSLYRVRIKSEFVNVLGPEFKCSFHWIDRWLKTQILNTKNNLASSFFELKQQQKLWLKYLMKRTHIRKLFEFTGHCLICLFNPATDLLITWFGSKVIKYINLV